ncbi:hypothetical protein OE494_30945 [Pseudomonas aeruginosa]|nr:hypothetical protein [Pseudomonas aeruginosa]
MTDHAELRRLAERADALYGMPSLEHEYAISKFRVASTPKAILALLDEIDGPRRRRRRCASSQPRHIKFSALWTHPRMS